jgi:hypothetical protein
MKTWFKGSEVEDIRLSGKRVYNGFLINIVRPFVNDCDLFSIAKSGRLCNTAINVQVPTSMKFLERLASVGEL